LEALIDSRIGIACAPKARIAPSTNLLGKPVEPLPHERTQVQLTVAGLSGKVELIACEVSLRRLDIASGLIRLAQAPHK